MIFADIPSGAAVFVDANIFVYAFAPDPQLGSVCEQLLERIEHGDLRAFASTQVLSDVMHRLMSLEACATYGWPFAGIAQRLKRHPGEVQKLSRYHRALDAIIALGVQIVPTSAQQVLSAAAVSQQHGVLSGDALIVVLMRDAGLTTLASHDSDFDRVQGIVRFGPA